MCHFLEMLQTEIRVTGCIVRYLLSIFPWATCVTRYTSEKPPEYCGGLFESNGFLKREPILFCVDRVHGRTRLEPANLVGIQGMGQADFCGRAIGLGHRGLHRRARGELVEVGQGQ
jgi:hypothetical protein